MSEEDWKRIEKLIKDNRSSGSTGLTALLLILFLNGCFKGCGY